MLSTRREREMTRRIHDRAASLAATAPPAYPDGTPFPAPQALDALGNLMLHMATFIHVDTEGIILRLGWMMALFGEVATTKPTTETLQTFYETRMWLRSHGLNDGYAVVTQAGLDLHRYWEMNGEMDQMLRALADNTRDA